VNGAVSTGAGDALEVAQNDPDIRAVVLTSAGDKSFCAGADLKAISRGENLMHPQHDEWIRQPLHRQAHHRRGEWHRAGRWLIAGAGGAFRIINELPRKVGLGLLFTGDSISANEALTWVLINEVVPDGPDNPALGPLQDWLRLNPSPSSATTTTSRSDRAAILGSARRWCCA
jgi:crotonobetainyl-CoA hydratase